MLYNRQERSPRRTQRAARPTAGTPPVEALKSARRRNRRTKHLRRLPAHIDARHSRTTGSPNQFSVA
jgi:hypothetical protein